MTASLVFAIANGIAGVVAAILVMDPKFHVGFCATIILSALSLSCLNIVVWTIEGYNYHPDQSIVIAMTCIALYGVRTLIFIHRKPHG